MPLGDEHGGFRIHRDSHVRLPDDGAPDVPESNEPPKTDWGTVAIALIVFGFLGWVCWLWWG